VMSQLIFRGLHPRMHLDLAPSLGQTILIGKDA
jgi:hypothetical protein